MSAIELYARAAPDFDARLAQTEARLRQAAAEHPGRIVQATSLGAEDMVITDLIARLQLPIALATLDTRALHAQTVELMGLIETHYELRLERHAPSKEHVLHFVSRHGSEAMYESVALRKACCDLRKMQPLKRLLEGRTAWIAGLRREQSENRAEVPFAESGADGRIKLNPLADWSWADVWHYIQLHQVPYSRLHDEFFPSIGCEPCTRAVAVGEPFRAGRWWWEQDGQKECGLHVKVDESETETESESISV